MENNEVFQLIMGGEIFEFDEFPVLINYLQKHFSEFCYAAIRKFNKIDNVVKFEIQPEVKIT